MLQIHFPFELHIDGNCVVEIQISEYPWDHCSLGNDTWQVDQKCVHLLDPGTKGTNFLEEWLAIWFQQATEFNTEMVNSYSNRQLLPSNYQCAWKPVNS